MKFPRSLDSAPKIIEEGKLLPFVWTPKGDVVTWKRDGKETGKFAE
jgi:hypothetical protein